MTEEQIESSVERQFDRLDARFMNMNSPMTQDEYDAEARAIHAWAEHEYHIAGLL